MLVTLIGYRGTGKSTVAPLLAARLGWPAVDADVVLEKQAGRTIADIFACDGEPVFRQLERQTIVELIQRDDLVLAVGGGAILNADTRRDLKAAGPVVWLQASPETIASRIAADPVSAARRPNLTSTGGIDEIRTLLESRTPMYQETSTIRVLTDDRSDTDIVAEIIALLPRASARSSGR